MAKLIKIDDKFYFDAEDGSEAVECKMLIETSKKSEKHPEGRPSVILPKGNITNRGFYGCDLFDETNIDGVVELTVKTTAPRKLSPTGVKQSIVKFLSEEEATEYTTLVEGAVEAYKAAKSTSKAKKPEDMTIEELEAYVEALKTGAKAPKAVTGPKSFIDMFSEAEYNRYNELLAIAAENKANAPKAVRGPLTEEEKAARNAKRIAKQISRAEELLAALKANAGADTSDGSEDFDDII